MILQLQPFKLTVVYKKGKYMYLADTSLRAALKHPAPYGTQEEVFQCYSGDTQELFGAELESLELDSPEMQKVPRRKSEWQHKVTVHCLSFVSLWLMVGRLISPTFQQCSVIIIHAGMS